MAGLHQQLGHVRARGLWQAGAAAGRGGVQMPDALRRKQPRVGTTWGWFRLFPQADHSVCPRTVVRRRHLLLDQTCQRAFKRAVRAAGILRPATPHTLSYCFATHSLQVGTDIRTVQDLFGHSDVSTTTIYTQAQVLKVAAGGTATPRWIRCRPLALRLGRVVDHGAVNA